MTPKPNVTIKKSVADSFEAALNELETVVKTMESGEMSLDNSLQAFQRGAALLRYCQDKLDIAEQTINLMENGEQKAFRETGEHDTK